MFNEIVKEKLNAEEEYHQIRKNMLKRLFNALDALEGKSVLADTIGNGFNNPKYFEQFSWHIFDTKTDIPITKLTIENDIEIESQTLPLTFKLDSVDVDTIEIDDNLWDKSTIENLKEPYFVENIILGLNNGDILRLELQW